jgi:tetratricopeptide (TPR) repeat protein/O-antigen ligase
MTLEKILRWFVIIGIFALTLVPWIVTTSLFFPYITGKNFAFRIIVELIGSAWLALALVDAKYRPRRGWILGCFALFILIIAIADAQGVNPFKSFWSNFERMDGWVTIAHLFVYLVVASIVLNTEKLWRRLLQVELLVSFITSLLGFLQVMGITVLGETRAAGLSARIDTTFGNPIYLAVFMLFNIFIAALLWSQMWAARGSGKRLGLSIAYGATIFVDTLTLFFTGTRGTELGLIGGTILAVLLYAFLQGSRKTRGIAAAFLVGVVLLGGGLYLARDTSAVKSVGFLDRLATLSLTDNTVHARFLNIQIAWHGVMERPILGWGQEDYAIVFDKYYDPRMYAQEAWFDRVHNIIFDWLIAGGVLGLASYLSVFGATLWTLWRKSKSNMYVFTIAERSILTGLLVGYFIHNLTVFDNVTSYILFGTVLGYIVWRRNIAEGSVPLIGRELLTQSLLPVTAVGMTVVAIALVWFINTDAIAQNQTLLSALEPQANISTNLALFQKAIGYGTFGTQEAREQLVQTAAQVAPASSDQVPTAVKQQFFNAAVNQMMLQQKASPLDARFPLFSGTVEDAYGDYTDASTSLELAHQLSPKKQSILYQIGSNDAALGDLKGSEQVFKQAYELDTDDQQALVYYIAAAVRASDDVTADTLTTPALIASGVAANQQLAAAYASRNQYAKIIPIWTAYIPTNPTDATGYTTLAAAYYETGNSAQAIAVLQALSKAIPSAASQASSFIQQIQSGAVKVH